MADLDLRDTESGSMQVANGTNKALHVYGLARRVVDGPQGVGTYSATDILGFNVLNVGSSGNWILNYKSGGISTILFSDMREDYFPVHLNSITLPTGAKAELFIA